MIREDLVRKMQPIDMEQLINRLNGILLSKVNLDSRGEIAEVHILANLNRSPKQIVRDVQSLAATTFDLALEHRVISVAQIADDGMIEIGIRLKIRDFDISYIGTKVQMTVSLEGYDKHSSGTASAMNTSVCRNMAVARACLAALHDYLGRDGIFEAVEIQRTKIAGTDSFSVAVSTLIDGEEQLLIGSSFIREDEYSSILCATLDAVNRFMNRLMKGMQ